MSFVSSYGDIAETLLKASSALSELASDLTRELDEGCEAAAVLSCSNEIERLQIWSQEHDVSTGKLDHMLREASPLRNRVISLLKELCSLGGVGGVDSINITRTDSPIPGDLEDGTPVEHEATSQPSEKGPATFGIHNFDTVSLGAKTCSSGLDTNISLEDSLPASSGTRAIVRVQDIITLLFELGPTLQDPAPHDRLKAIQYQNAAQPDLHHARTKFPKADQKLVRRLGFANWERRQALRSFRTDYESKLRGEKLPQVTRTDSARKDFAIFVGGGSELDALSITDSSARNVLAPSTASETDQTKSDFNFSGHGTKSTPGSEFSSGPVGGHRHPSPVDQILRVPPPPEPNQYYDGQVFLCPYCFRRISDLRSRSDWMKHVFRDLEPYMCTYGDCIRPDKTYGEKRTWWEHEIELHRTQRSWTCAPCLGKNHECDFKSLASFEQHFLEHHPSVSNKAQIRNIQKICEKQVGATNPRTMCPLCRYDIEPMDDDELPDMERSVRQHVADHLEQLALFAALPAGQSGIEDDEPDFMDDSDSEIDERVEIESIISDDRLLSRKEVRIANVRRFLVDQEEPNNVPLGDRRSSGPARVVSTRSAANDFEPGSPTRVENSRELKQSFPIHTVLHPPNEHFYGRDNLLLEVDRIFAKSGSICVFHGVGGVGKTLTAVEYIHRYRDSFDGIFWLQADTAPGLSDSYIQMATALGFAQDADDHMQATDKGRNWLQETDRRWLLIFDNVERWEAISPYLPYPIGLTNGSVLITTQVQDLTGLPEGSRQLRLEPLDEEAGAEMLLGYLSKDGKTDPEKDLAQEISTFVGGLPVAIAHVAGYADYSHYSLEELLETFREWRRRSGIATDEADDLPTTFRKAAFSYDETLAMVWNVTLRELSRDAQDVMYILAYLNCEAVPESMLWGRVHEEPSLHFLDMREKLRSKRIKESLVRRRLVHIKEVDGEVWLSVHRSLQRSIRETLAQDVIRQQLVFDQAVALVREVFPQSSPLQQPTPERWPEYQRLLPHLHSLHDAFYKMKPHIVGSTDLAKILSDAGMDQHERGITKEGLLLLKTAEDVLDSISYDSQDVIRADIHAVIAMMYDNTGIGTRSEAFRRRQIALRIRERVVKESASVRRQDEVLLYNSWMELAIAHLHFHRYEEAEPIIEKCLRKYREWGSEDDEPFEYAKYYNKMGLVRMYQGKFNEAIRLAERGVYYMSKTGYALFESRFKFDLACIVLQSGDINHAMRLHREIFDARLDRLGQSNELTLHSRYAIGALYEIKGQPEEAEFWFRKALERWRAASWPDEAVSRAQFHLARVLQLQGKADLEETQTLHEKAIEVLNRLLPLDRPPELKDDTDEAILFDHMLTISGARFTGQGLLQCFMKKVERC